ncbi:hypothetical protein [Rhodococcus erythropolis]
MVQYSSEMSETAELDEVQEWSPAPDEGEDGTMLTTDGRWV